MVSAAAVGLDGWRLAVVGCGAAASAVGAAGGWVACAGRDGTGRQRHVRDASRFSSIFFCLGYGLVFLGCRNLEGI